MLIALSTVIPVLAALMLGALFSRVGWQFVLRKMGGVTNACLYLLLIVMGLSVGQVDGIMGKLGEVGLTALAVAGSASLGVALAVLAVKLRSVRTPGTSQRNSSGSGLTFSQYIKDPAQLLGLVLLGFGLSVCGFLPRLDYDAFVTGLLYLLIFLIGVRLSQAQFRMMDVLFNRKGLSIAVLTLCGTYVGLAALALVTGKPLATILVLGSGFGWYTLSGIMLTKLGEPLLGSIAFFSDVFREMLALVLIPSLGRLGATSVAIGVSGATCMDVTLPVIERHCEPAEVPVAFASGALITLLVPFLLPTSYYLMR